MNRFALRFIGMLLLCGALCVPALAFGDAGNFTSSSDFGGGGDGDGDGAEILFYLLQLLFEIMIDAFEDGNYTLGYVCLGIIVAIIGGIAFLIYYGAKSDKKKVVVKDSFDTSKLKPMSKLEEKEPGFSRRDLEDFAAEQYANLQYAWTNKDLEHMRSALSPGLFAQLDRQLGEYRRNKTTNYVDDIAVTSACAEGWYRDGDEICVAMHLVATITDYTLDDRTGDLVRGSRDDRLTMQYRWILSRSKDVRGALPGQTTAMTCPNCGAQLEVGKSAQCPYCDSILQADTHSWVISSIQGLSQNTSKGAAKGSKKNGAKRRRN